MNLNTRNISQQATLCGRMFKRVILTAAVIGLSGCATMTDWFADEDEIKIRRIAPIENQITPKEVWSYTIGDGVDEYFSRLKPVFANDTVYAAERHGEVVALIRIAAMWYGNVILLFSRTNPSGMTLLACGAVVHRPKSARLQLVMTWFLSPLKMALSVL